MEAHSPAPRKSLWYTYFGSGGAAVFAFLYIIAAMFWLYYVLRWC